MGAEPVDDPYAFYAQLRREAPVWRVPGTDAFLVSTWELVTEAAGRVADFSNHFRRGFFTDDDDGAVGVLDRLCCVGAGLDGEGGGMMPRRSDPVHALPDSAFKGFRFPPEIVVLTVRWYLRFGLSYRDVEELLAERGIEVDHVTVYRWVQRFTPLLADAARPCRHTVGDRWYVDETYVKVAGRWRYVYRAIDQYGQIIDVCVSPRRDSDAARRFFTTALRAHGDPAEVVTDRAWTLRAVIDEIIPAAFHNTDQYANNRIEADHGRLKSRRCPMRGLKRDCSARVVIRGHAFMQNLRRGHYELGIDTRTHRRVATAFTELARTI
jgi:transposase-like protein